jgi:hypothetical protein
MVLRYVIAVLLALHGLIHTLGFAATWQLGQITAIPSTPTFPSGLLAGSALPRLLGVLWLLLALAFIGAAVGLATTAAWWRGLLFLAAVVSLALCVAWWNDAKFGFVIDIIILLGVAAATWVVHPGQA